jgi:tripartite-type tricarboxylate transporter receptor subunit TctC
MKKRSLLATGALALASMLLTPPAARAQTFPEKPIRLIVPFGVGGTSDIYARIISRIIEEKKILPQPVVVLNVPGAGSAVGSRQVKDSPADGYTLLLSHQGIMTAQVMGLADFGPDALEPVAEFGKFCLVYAVAETSPYKTFGDLLAAAKKNPGSIRESTNIGSGIHFASLTLSRASGLNPRYIRASATPERITHLMGGHAEVAVFSIGELGAIQSNGVRLILSFSPEPDRFAPGVPTARSLGYDSTFCIRNWVFAPKGTPADRIATIVKALRAVFDTPEMKTEFERWSTQPTFLEGAELAQLIAAENKVFQSLADAVPK